MNTFLEKIFHLTERGTDTKTEIIAGVTTFLTVMYIVPLNGIIMSAAEMPIEAVITATALITIIATIFNGLWSNTPIVMSVGLGLNSYFVYTLVLGKKLPWETVLGMVFISGIFFLILTMTRIRKMIIDSISKEFKIATSAGIGLFIAFIGLKQMGLIAAHPATLVTFGNLGDKNVLLGLIGLFIMIGLIMWKVKGAFIVGIIATTIIGLFMGVTNAPTQMFSLPASISPIFMKLDISSAFTVALIAPIITFMLTDLFDSLGTLAGVGYRAGIFDTKDSKPIQKTLEADAGATVLASFMGLSTTTSFIESAAGVEEGGRTGLTAVVTGLLFTLTLFLLPLFKVILANAIFPVLVIVGVFMFADLKKIDFLNYEIALPAFFIIILMPLTFSITKGLAAGFIVHLFIKLITGKYKELNVVTVVLALISFLAFIIG